VRDRDQGGFTLIEMMIAVAVVGVLAGMAIFMFTRQTRKAKETEVHAMFGAIKLRQQAFYLENDEYLSTASSDGEFFPTATPPAGTKQTFDIDDSPEPPSPQDVKYPGPSWRSLRLDPDRTELHCVYLTVAGKAGDSTNVGAKAAAAPFNLGSAELPVPAVDWYYVMAECDFDGDGTPSRYFSLSDTEKMIVDKRGE
jgi:prepilin-type N-terminal cleavage/methylation domain-containing protein